MTSKDKKTIEKLWAKFYSKGKLSREEQLILRLDDEMYSLRHDNEGLIKQVAELSAVRDILRAIKGLMGQMK